MKYYPKGWHIYNFLVTPQELKDILRGFHIVEHCRRVPADYIESNFADFVRDYENFYRLLTSGERIDHIILNNLLKGFSNNLSKCAYGAPFQDSMINYGIKQWISVSLVLGLIYLLYTLTKNVSYKPNSVT